MNNFIEKWQNDKKYRAKIKLISYTIGIIIISIYAFSLDNYTGDNNIIDNSTLNEDVNYKDILNIPNTYTYEININIDNDIYKYYGHKLDNKINITKEIDNIKTNYVYQNNNYYQDEDGLYIKTTRDKVYDVVNYNYIDLDNIKLYLSKAEKNNNQYLVYLKDIILNTDSEEYFIILVNNNRINIDYTPLIKEFNSNIIKYQVDIMIKDIG